MHPREVAIRDGEYLVGIRVKLLNSSTWSGVKPGLNCLIISSWVGWE
jgi:hypothetical protein